MNPKTLFKKEVLEIQGYHLDEHEGIKLNQNEYPEDIPIALKAEIIEKLLKTPWNRYPLGDTILLQKKMAKILNVWPDNLTFANGSNVLIQALMIATRQRKKIIVLDPTFGVYELQAKILGNQIIRVPLNDDDFSIPFELCMKTIKKEKPSIIFIPNPNAPTGNLFNLDVLKKIVEYSGCLVVIDEAYYPFSNTTVIDWIKQYENLAILRTFSKAYALGGLRLGYMIAEPDVSRQVQKCLLPFCLSKLTLITALTLFDNIDYVEHYTKYIINERERVFSQMQTMAEIKAYPSQANFILFESKNSEALFNRLLEQKIIVRQVNNGRRLTQALRVTIGTKEENDAFLIALKKTLR